MKKIKFELGLKGCFFICCCMALLLVSCGTSRKASVSAKDKTFVEWEDPLSFEQRRKFDYYFLEAIRLKEILQGKGYNIHLRGRVWIYPDI